MTKQEKIEEAKELALFFLRQMGCHDTATPDQIENSVLKSLQVYKDIQKKDLIKLVEADFKIWVEDYRIIEKEEAKKPWLLNHKAKIKWNFWNRYKWYLEEKKHFPPKTISSIDNLTDRTLDALFDPKQKVQIDKRGMVVGQVQSGKTANYTGLICKAADAGFNVIIVLAGIHKNLRSQTQLRLDEGFLGFDTQQERVNKNNKRWIGVGELSSSRNLKAHSLTSSEDNGDFNKRYANNPLVRSVFSSDDPIIAVVKKNASVLDKLNIWLSEQATKTIDGHKILNKSLLIIDDEADNASINTKIDDLQPTKINGQIRNLLRLFKKSAYVGYTATPFANIFIPLNDDNLFPRDFITNIPAPSNYIGPDKIFGFEPIEDNTIEDTLPIVNQITDYHKFVPDKHKIHDELPNIDSFPKSLRTAIKCFILTCTIRRIRGQINVHNSMLIHISRFQLWQTCIKELVEDVFNYYRRGIEHKNKKILSEIRKTFEEDTDTYQSYKTTSKKIIESDLSGLDPNIIIHTWEEVEDHLFPASSKIEVKEIHGGAKDTLDYFNSSGVSVIAVGGNKLSRGLTLEGLSVSYFLRSSRMYDTLMQMGRWFGYRPGYVDLCRLFTSQELNEWFCHITLASEELRKEFNYMSDIAGSTPEQYALKVRTHPGVLQISATNKIRTAVNVNISWSGVLIESYKLSKDIRHIERNLNNLKILLDDINLKPEIKKMNYLWKNVSSKMVISFLQNFVVPENPIASPDRIADFIIEKNKHQELNSWNIALMSSRSKNNYYKLSNKLDKIYLFDRKQEESSSNKHIYYIRKSHIISPNHEFIDLNDDEYDLALEKTISKKLKANLKQDFNQKVNYPNGSLVRNDLEIKSARHPLLLLYLLNPKKANIIETENPIVGFAIRFPGSDKDISIQYAVNEQLLDTFDSLEDPDDYEYED